MKKSFFIFFQNENCTYQSAKEWLEDYAFTVTEASDQLMVSANGFTFTVVIKRGTEVLAEAQAIGKNSPHQAAMNRCDAKFEVTFEDLSTAPNQISTLMDLQDILQDASKGYVFLPWNGSLSKPRLI